MTIVTPHLISLDSLNEFGKHVSKPEMKPHPPALDTGIFGSATEPSMDEFEEIFSEEFAKEVIIIGRHFSIKLNA